MIEEFHKFKNAIKKTVFKAGEPAYLISTTFLTEYEECAKKNIPITLIDNSPLFKKELFKPNLIEGRDYVAVNQDMWDELQFKFDVKREARVKVLDNGRPELYPMNITVQYGRQTKNMIISKSADISTLILRIVMEFCIPPENRFELFTPGSKEPVKQEGTVFECLKGFYRVEVRLVERQTQQKPQQVRGVKTLFSTKNTVSDKSSTANAQNGAEGDKTESERPKDKPPGLKNLGNTCYMNSSLQCLASIPQFVAQITQCDPQEKKLTKALSSIISALVTRKNTVVETNAFKAVVDELLPQFRGFGQQDAQEFTSALIDKLRAESPSIAQIFYGDLKSSTVCAECKKVSVSDEKFSCLSLPVAGLRRVTFVPWSIEEPMVKLFAPPKGKQFVLLAEKDGKFAEVDWPAPEFDELFALEHCPLRQNKAFAVVRVRATGGRTLTSPLLAEVPVNEKVSESRLRGLIGTRVGELWVREQRPQATSNWRIVSGPERFRRPSDKTVICQEQILVEVRSNFADQGKGFRDVRTRPLSTTSSLSDLIGAFLECTRLDADNVWKCSCGVSTRAIRQSEIVTAPEVLILQLKRFAVGKHSVDRDATPVEIPRELDINGKKYALRSISNHAGGTGAGHYTTLAERNGYCFNFNDSKVSFSQGFPHESYGAYVLFYSLC